MNFSAQEVKRALSYYYLLAYCPENKLSDFLACDHLNEG